MAVDPRRLILGPFAPRAPRFPGLCTLLTRRRLISPSPGMFPEGGPSVDGISRDFPKIVSGWPSIRASGFWGHAPHARLGLSDFRTCQSRSLEIDPPHQESAGKPNPAIAANSRYFAKNLRDWRSILAAGIWGRSPRWRLFFADFCTFLTRPRLVSPLRREFFRKAGPAIAAIPRDPLKILCDWPSTLPPDSGPTRPNRALFRRLLYI